MLIPHENKTGDLDKIEQKEQQFSVIIDIERPVDEATTASTGSTVLAPYESNMRDIKIRRAPAIEESISKLITNNNYEVETSLAFHDEDRTKYFVEEVPYYGVELDADGKIVHEAPVPPATTSTIPKFVDGSESRIVYTGLEQRKNQLAAELEALMYQYKNKFATSSTDDPVNSDPEFSASNPKNKDISSFIDPTLTSVSGGSATSDLEQTLLNLDAAKANYERAVRQEEAARANLESMKAEFAEAQKTYDDAMKTRNDSYWEYAQMAALKYIDPEKEALRDAWRDAELSALEKEAVSEALDADDQVSSEVKDQARAEAEAARLVALAAHSAFEKYVNDQISAASLFDSTIREKAHEDSFAANELRSEVEKEYLKGRSDIEDKRINANDLQVSQQKYQNGFELAQFMIDNREEENFTLKWGQALSRDGSENTYNYIRNFVEPEMKKTQEEFGRVVDGLSIFSDNLDQYMDGLGYQTIDQREARNELELVEQQVSIIEEDLNTTYDEALYWLGADSQYRSTTRFSEFDPQCTFFTTGHESSWWK